MNDEVFDVFTQSAERGISRRASLTALGAAGLAAALAAPFSADAKKKSGKKDRRKRKDKKDKKDKQESDGIDRCPQQVAQCTDFVTALCAGDPECLGQTSCCDFLGSCEAYTFLICLANQL